jgi:hypothetical protein
MRLKLAGTMSHPDPVVLTLKDGVPFLPQPYLDLGYTNFDVLCIGGGGGMGGGIDTANTGTLVRNYGGAGGGGGLHRVQGLLSALPLSCPVIVGYGGAFGTEHNSDPAFTTNGWNGGYSSFNNTTCRASGGKGGKKVQSNSLTVPTLADGGDGGIGGRTDPGGGGLGGATGRDGEDGSWDGTIGEGGGGGAGGVGNYGTTQTAQAATAGGRGSYNPSDLSVYGPGELTTTDPFSGATSVVPGGAGGGKARPVNGLPYLYGRSFGQRVTAEAGIVVIRLTSV